MSDDYAITEAAERARRAERIGDEIARAYWTERAQRLSDQAEAVRRRFLTSGSGLPPERLAEQRRAFDELRAIEDEVEARRG